MQTVYSTRKHSKLKYYPAMHRFRAGFDFLLLAKNQVIVRFRHGTVVGCLSVDESTDEKERAIANIIANENHVAAVKAARSLLMRQLLKHAVMKLNLWCERARIAQSPCT